MLWCSIHNLKATFNETYDSRVFFFIIVLLVTTMYLDLLKIINQTRPIFVKSKKNKGQQQRLTRAKDDWIWSRVSCRICPRFAWLALWVHLAEVCRCSQIWLPTMIGSSIFWLLLGRPDWWRSNLTSPWLNLGWGYLIWTMVNWRLLEVGQSGPKCPMLTHSSFFFLSNRLG